MFVATLFLESQDEEAGRSGALFLSIASLIPLAISSAVAPGGNCTRTSFLPGSLPVPFIFDDEDSSGCDVLELPF